MVSEGKEDLLKGKVVAQVVAVVVAFAASLAGLSMLSTVITARPPIKDPRSWPFLIVSLAASGVLV